MKTPRAFALLFAGVLFAATVTSVAAQQASGPSTNVAWTIETLNFVRNGDPERGEMLSTKLECASCHGDKGVSTNDTWPSLAGQPAGYTYKVLRDYREDKLSGTRRGELMSYVVEEMSDQDIADVASYYAQQGLPPARAASPQDAAETLNLLGDPARFIPPCSVCHGNKGQGDFPDFPALAGQSPEFLERSLMDFKSGARGNDVYSRMRLISRALSDEEIKGLSAYFAAKAVTVAQD